MCVCVSCKVRGCDETALPFASALSSSNLNPPEHIANKSCGLRSETETCVSADERAEDYLEKSQYSSTTASCHR